MEIATEAGGLPGTDDVFSKFDVLVSSVAGALSGKSGGQQMNFLTVMALPLLACLLLALILPALGQHVLARGVIFVDLALAQIAALGQSVAFLLGAEPHDPSMYLLVVRLHAAGRRAVQLPVGPRALGAAGGLHRDLVRAGDGRHAAAAVERSPRRGAREGALSGEALGWVTWKDIVDHGGAVRDRRRVPVLLPTEAPALLRGSEDRRGTMGLSVKKWDFLFYASFGLVVTSSVKVSGVLAVFSYLIVPDRLLDAAGPAGPRPALLGVGHRVRGLRPGRGALLPQGLADGRHDRVPVRRDGGRRFALRAHEVRGFRGERRQAVGKRVPQHPRAGRDGRSLTGFAARAGWR